MALSIVLMPLVLEQKTFVVGDTIRITVSFKYSVGVDTTVPLWAGPYYTNLIPPFKHMIYSCSGGPEIVSLPAATTPTEKTATVDFPLVPKANGGIENGIYGLGVQLADQIAYQDAVIIVTGNPAGAMDTISQMLPMIMMIMMLGMVMPMMQGGEG